jgi:ABC-type proline/glycine betaine transport system ATPase subunit
MGKLVKSKSVLGAGAKDKGSELKSVTGPKPKDSKSRTGKQDVILAVMGMTGAGKSSFISNATGSNKIRIGDTLYSGESLAFDNILRRLTCYGRDLGHTVISC